MEGNIPPEELESYCNDLIGIVAKLIQEERTLREENDYLKAENKQLKEGLINPN